MMAAFNWLALAVVTSKARPSHSAASALRACGIETLALEALAQVPETGARVANKLPIATGFP